MKIQNKFPSISRTFTENKLLKRVEKNWLEFSKQYKLVKIYAYFSVILTLLVSLVFVGLIFFITFSFSQNFIKYKDLNIKRQEITSKINFWKSISEKYSGYPDANFNIAILYYQLNDLKNSRKYLMETLILNPDFINAQKLDKELTKNGY